MIPLIGSLTTDEKKTKWLCVHVAWHVVPEVELSAENKLQRTSSKRYFLFLNSML